MFDVSFYLGLVNAEYKGSLQKTIASTDLPKRDRVLASLNAHLEKTPLKSGHFNHYRPARYFAEHIGTLATKIAPEVLDRFEEAFKKLNSLL